MIHGLVPACAAVRAETSCWVSARRIHVRTGVMVHGAPISWLRYMKEHHVLQLLERIILAFCSGSARLPEPESVLSSWLAARPSMMPVSPHALPQPAAQPLSRARRSEQATQPSLMGGGARLLVSHSLYPSISFAMIRCCGAINNSRTRLVRPGPLAHCHSRPVRACGLVSIDRSGRVGAYGDAGEPSS